ncbi:class I SAM-dependent methyltransferase [Chitinophaga vietnamensis]|uniref:class I SAM-dependent methyltransferase n=1 Tax=Chitinophaga vietnamensis TaxID=2593957 RepID=UPI001177E128|nr:class I SAM-dependent methyltransferase [Chitinophaga vietnamensis]
MDHTPDYIATNRDMWNQRTAVHVSSDFYDVPAFLNGKNSLNSIELALLGNVQNKHLLHLQCHFGQDTLSLARMGANVTGVDLSDTAIAQAEAFAKQLDLQNKSRFICCDLYSLPQHFDEQADIVFTSYGTIGWLPDLDRWAAVVNRFLKPGGYFVMAEFHQMVMMFDEQFKEIKYSYFNRGEIIEEVSGSYTDRSAPLKSLSYSWDHALSETIGALLRQGLQLEFLEEYDYSPYNCFNNTIEKDGKFYIKGLEGKIPMVYAFRFFKPA